MKCYKVKVCWAFSEGLCNGDVSRGINNSGYCAYGEEIEELKTTAGLGSRFPSL